MKTLAAVMSIVGALSLGCGCVMTGAAGDESNRDETLTGAAPEAICRQECHQQCTVVRGIRSCQRVCRSVCR